MIQDKLDGRASLRVVAKCLPGTLITASAELASIRSRVSSPGAARVPLGQVGHDVWAAQDVEHRALAGIQL